MDTDSIRRRLETCLARMEDLLAGKKKFTKEESEFLDLLMARKDRLLREYKSSLIPKEEADRRKAELDEQLITACKEIRIRFSYEWVRYCKRPKVRSLTESDLEKECEQFLYNIIEETFSEPPFNLPDSLNQLVTLKQFMQRFCYKGQTDFLDSHIASLRRAHQRGIKLPKHVGKWRSGQKKLYKTQDLLDSWPKYCEKRPSLPRLKPR